MNTPPSILFGGGPPYVALFVSALVLWEGAEMVLNTKWRSGSSTSSQDRGSQRLLALLIGVAFALDFACALLLPGAAIRPARTVFTAGICCVMAGTALRLYAVATLGRYFTVDVATRAEQPVIDSGPYRCIRHPAYTGLLLALLGFALAIGNWAGLLAMLVLPGVAFGYRIAVEEAAMLSTLGETYARYMRRTWRLIPYLL